MASDFDMLVFLLGREPFPTWEEFFSMRGTSMRRVPIHTRGTSIVQVERYNSEHHPRFLMLSQPMDPTDRARMGSSRRSSEVGHLALNAGGGAVD